ncbi:MAG TPA: aldehyde dehydrogenase [Armatimonadetes bacterium]|nr:aldehyde dehydrogenase [Armatimonadota bacterium]
MYIGGEWVEASSGERFDSENPATGEILGSVPKGTPADIDAAVSAALKAFPAWRDTDPDARGRWLLSLAAAIRANADDLALLLARESGHYIGKAQGLVEFTAQNVEFHAGLADKARGSSIPTGPGRLALTRLEPVGVTGHIVPWNYPLFLITRSVAPAVALGNTAVIKPATPTSLIAVALAEIVGSIGLPPGVFNVVTGPGSSTGAALAGHPDVRSITFTGSVETGRSVMEAAVPNMTKLTLELGGKSPVIIFPDVDIETATEVAMQGALSRCGQVCIAGTRLFVHADIYDAVVARLAERFAAVRLGDTLDPRTQMGPLVSADQLRIVERYVAIGKQEARLVVGGARPDDPALQKGCFYLPTLFADVTNDMRIAQEEIFGPVLSAIKWTDEDEVIAQANDSPFGLAAAVWCNDTTKAIRTATRLEAGGVFVNEWIGEDFKAPHGGYKLSGIGRENGFECISQYTEVKHIAINLVDKKPENWCDAPL